MTEKHYGSVWTIDHCYPLSESDLSNEPEKIKTTCRINLRPMYPNKNISKDPKIDNRIYLMQEKKAKNFLKLNAQEG